MKNQKQSPELIESKATLDDIIFQNKNHDYGAFAIRKSYELTMRKSFLFGTVIFVSALLVSNIYANRDKVDIGKVYNGGGLPPSLPLPKEELPKVIPPPIQQKAPDVASTRSLPPVIVEEVDPTEELPPTTDQLSQAPPSDVTNVGTPGEIDDVIIETKIDEPIVDIEKEDPNTIYIVVEQNAEYPGGLREMAKFLQKNLKYPDQAANAGIEGKVFLNFLVNSNGEISDVQVTKGIGFKCDEEAIRVIKAMPKWSPGKQSGRAVKSRFTLPIAFKLE